MLQNVRKFLPGRRVALGAKRKPLRCVTPIVYERTVSWRSSCYAPSLLGNHSAAVAALIAKAKIAGLWVEKTESENTNLNYVMSDQLPSEQQWIEERVKQS
jgi:hypothetical protein